MIPETTFLVCRQLRYWQQAFQANLKSVFELRFQWFLYFVSPCASSSLQPEVSLQNNLFRTEERNPGFSFNTFCRWWDYREVKCFTRGGGPAPALRLLPPWLWPPLTCLTRTALPNPLRSLWPDPIFWVIPVDFPVPICFDLTRLFSLVPFVVQPEVQLVVVDVPIFLDLFHQCSECHEISFLTFSSCIFVSSFSWRPSFCSLVYPSSCSEVLAWLISFYSRQWDRSILCVSGILSSVCSCMVYIPWWGWLVPSRDSSVPVQMWPWQAALHVTLCTCSLFLTHLPSLFCLFMAGEGDEEHFWSLKILSISF